MYVGNGGGKGGGKEVVLGRVVVSGRVVGGGDGGSGGALGTVVAGNEESEGRGYGILGIRGGVSGGERWIRG